MTICRFCKRDRVKNSSMVCEGCFSLVNISPLEHYCFDCRAKVVLPHNSAHFVRAQHTEPIIVTLIQTEAHNKKIAEVYGS